MVQKVSKSVRYTLWSAISAYSVKVVTLLCTHCGAMQCNLACLAKVVTLTTPTHVANIANEWLPCTNIWEMRLTSTLKVKIKIPALTSF